MNRDTVPEYRLALWDARLEELFDDPEREQVLSWLVEVGDRSRLVVVGAGFTKNATSSTGQRIPDWDDLTRQMARHLRLNEKVGNREQRHDPLELADLFVAEHSREALELWLENQLDDGALTTEAAHRALWESGPHAVITTNFLDTALEKPISSVGIPVYECTHLPRKLASHERHLVYFHGHRRAPETWVISRRDYEDLPTKRPAIDVKVRQLLAEFPAVVVGYSMRDPDFHQIYRDTARVLDDRHPPGLVVLPFPDNDERLGRLRTQYWKTLRVRFVHFREERRKDADTINRAYESFFRLVETPRSRQALRPAFTKPTNIGGIRIAFKNNLRRAQEMFADFHRLPFLAKQNDEVWNDVLALSLSDDAAKSAETKQQASLEHLLQTNKSKSEGPKPKEAPGATPENEPPPEPLKLEDWVTPGSRRVEVARRLMSLLALHDGRVRQVEQMLLRADRDDVISWLRRHLDDDYLAPSYGTLYARRMLALVDTDSDATAQFCADGAREFDPALFEALRDILGQNPDVSDQTHSALTDELLRARTEHLEENREGARDRYLKVWERLGTDSLTREELSLQAYFSAAGASWLFERNENMPNGLERHLRAIEQTLPVRQWKARTRDAKEAAYRAAAGRNGFRRQPGGYEETEWTYFSSPSELWREYQYAKTQGAPLGTLHDLLLPLLGTFPSSATELEIRLEFNLNKPGEWLREELSEKTFSVRPKTRGMPPLGPTRKATLESVNRALFPPARVPYGTSARGRLSVLSACPEVLLEECLPLALEQLEALEDCGNETLLADAWLGLAGCCSWTEVRSGLLRYLDGWAQHKLRQRHLVTKTTRFPWMDWIRVDNFFDDGGREFLAKLLEERGDPWAYFNGWLLLHLLHLDPDNEWLQQRALAWAKSDDAKNDDRFEPALALLLQLKEFPKDPGPVWETAKARVERGIASLDDLRRLAEAKHETSLTTRAQVDLREKVAAGQWCDLDESNVAHGSAFSEIEAMTAVATEGDLPRDSQQRLLTILGFTWNPLVLIAPLLKRRLWNEDTWEDLLRLLTHGDGERHRNEWKLRCAGLVWIALSQSEEVRDTLLSDDFAELRRAIPRNIFDGDQRIAREAMRALPQLFLATRSETEKDELITALEAGGNDLRVLVAREAACAAGFLSEHGDLPEQYASRIKTLLASLASDPCAAIVRQTTVGRALGKSHARKTNSGLDREA